MNFLLKVEHLSIGFENTSEPVVDDISFQLNESCTLGIVGESGSGKSLTVLSLPQLLPGGARLLSGSAFFESTEGPVDLFRISRKQMQKLRGNQIAYIFQEPMTALNPFMTCGKQVAEQILLHRKASRKQAKSLVLTLFSEVLLPNPAMVYDKYPHQLSGGQRQRVMIAMALACRPRLIIADEPTTALDITVQYTILRLIKQLQQKYGMGLIFISHDLGVIKEIADEVLVMHKGKLVESGSVTQLLKQPKHPYTKGLIACRPNVHVRLKKLPVVSDFFNETEPVFESVSTVARTQLHEMMYSNAPVLTISNLSVSYSQSRMFGSKTIFKALNDVALKVYAGETLGIVGESGCGKTTLGKAIMRLIETKSGSVLYKNREILTLTKSELIQMRRKIQFIFQDPFSSLNPRQTIGNAVLEPLLVHRLVKSRREGERQVFDLFEQVGLDTQFYNRYPHELSGGQRQRAVIARALITRPEVVICDESVSALDVSVQAMVLNLLNELKTKFGLTYLFISHDLGVIKFMCDRVVVMQNGQIIEIGETDRLYHNPQNEYTRKLIDSIPGIH